MLISEYWTDGQSEVKTFLNKEGVLLIIDDDIYLAFFYNWNECIFVSNLNWYKMYIFIYTWM